MCILLLSWAINSTFSQYRTEILQRHLAVKWIALNRCSNRRNEQIWDLFLLLFTLTHNTLCISEGTWLSGHLSACICCHGDASHPLQLYFCDPSRWSSAAHSHFTPPQLLIQSFICYSMIYTHNCKLLGNLIYLTNKKWIHCKNANILYTIF